MAKKAEAEAKKQAVVDRQKEAAEAAEWNKGANARKASRDEAAAAKADEAARKRAEKAALLAEEEASNTGKAKGGGGNVKNQANTKKKKNDLSLLEDALVKDADKKVRKKKEEMLQKKQEEEAAIKAKQEKQQHEIDPLFANTNAMIGDDDDVDLVGREANIARMELEGASGIDAALSSLNVGGDDVKSAKALYKAFEARMLPQIKEEYPGLRLTQQREKVFTLWKRSPENPDNH